MKKFFSIVLAVILAVSLVACGTTTETTDDGTLKVGISMPTKSLQRWIQDGDNLKAQFEAAGYEVDLQYGGDNEIPQQVSQLENMISSGVKVLVIAAIDGTTLSDVLAQAKDKDIAVVAYDRLILNTDAVTFYATFDNFGVGQAQGMAIAEALDLDTAAGPFNLEIFTGDPGDNNAKFFFQGAMDILQTYIDSGKLVVLSGQTTQQQTGTAQWSAEVAQSRMETLISQQGYAPNGVKLDAILCSNDSTAQGAITALKNAGYTPDDIPVITGQDCDIPNVAFLLEGYQTVSIFKDTRVLADQTVKMVTQYLKGETVEVNDTDSYNNNTKNIDTFLCTPTPCYKDDVQSLLFDTGYYDWANFPDLAPIYGPDAAA